ncbi:hypothetical protein KAR34_07205 [bacterium]|nr:hypothetical protein [bacterium]
MKIHLNIFYAACLFFMLVLAPMAAEAISTAEESAHSPDLYQQHFDQAVFHLGEHNFEASIEECKLALQYQPEAYLIRAIWCLDLFEIAEQLNVRDSKQRKLKIAMYEKMVKIAEAGIKYAPDKGECYFFRGLAHARLCTTAGILYNLFMAKGIEKDWLHAIACNSNYITPTGENLLASGHIALASYYRLCPSFFLLTWIFGISGDLDKSVEYGKIAYDLDPRIEVIKEYGISLITRGLANKKEEDINTGKTLLAKIPTLPLQLKTDPIDIEHSKLLLENIKLCPGYSRDQQQEISAKALQKELRKKKQSN